MQGVHWLFPTAAHRKWITSLMTSQEAHSDANNDANNEELERRRALLMETLYSSLASCHPTCELVLPHQQTGNCVVLIIVFMTS